MLLAWSVAVQFVGAYSYSLMGWNDLWPRTNLAMDHNVELLAGDGALLDTDPEGVLQQLGPGWHGIKPAMIRAAFVRDSDVRASSTRGDSGRCCGIRHSSDRSGRLRCGRLLTAFLSEIIAGLHPQPVLGVTPPETFQRQRHSR